MSNASDCLPRRELERLMLGQLPVQETERLAQHLEQCEQCLATVQMIRAEDTLVEAMRAGAQLAQQPTDPTVQRVIERVQNLQPSRGTPGNVALPETTGEGAKASADGIAKPPAHLSPPQAPDEIGRLGRYRILKQLGRGGMGTVYLAHDTQLDRRVALKIPLFTVEDGPDMLERFYREARAAATLDHPNICAVHDVGEINGTLYLTMAYIEGKPLSDVILPALPSGERGRREGSPRAGIPPRQAVAVVRKLAQALAHAHARGVIHRDLKPSNIMANKERDLVIMDFGLARRAARGDATLTQTGMVVGTPAYMSPEQARGDHHAVGAASDVYSLGVILFELLTGQRPFRGSPTVVLGQVLHVEPPKPSSLRRDLNPRLDAICLKAMAKKIEDRYRSMDELAGALGDYLRSDPKAQTRAAGASPAQTSAPHAHTGCR